MNNLHLRDGKIAFRWKRWRNKKRQEVSYCLMVLFSGAVLFGAGGMALAGPTGGQVTSGTGTINQAGTTTTIDQTSSVLNINWQTFSTAPNETVNFVQPGSTSLAINRVVGGVPSYLQGALNANGRVFILNSAGITFAGTSRVNVGALLATTAMSVNGNVSGLANYSAPSGSGGSVINQGSITVSNGGFAILAAPYVQNTGFIKADLGTVALAGTNSFTLDLRGDGLINFVVPPGTAAQIAADGQKVGVDNSGTLQARSGQVIISANVATQVVNAVVNMSGVVDADALSANGAGGSVLVTSTGDINLGGTITAQGNGTGAGGSIVTKAAGLDNVQSGANLLAAGGAEGKGGHIEVSGKGVILNGNIDPGYSGSLLLDPQNINVTTVAGHNNVAGSTVSENFIEHFLDSGHRTLTLTANHDITFTAVGNTHDLNFNSGNLRLVAGATAAGGSILFDANHYEIHAGAGSVNMFAHAGNSYHAVSGNIGSSYHRLSVVTGHGTGMYAGVTQAGDVVLKAGHDIFVDNVTVKSSGNSHFNAIFSASAGHDFNAAGLIDVEAHARGSGAETADAEVKIRAGHDINLHGLNDIAFASETGFSSVNVAAHAGVALNAHNVLHDSGAVTVNARVGGHSGTNFVASANLVANNATSVDINGAVNVSAIASDFDVDHAKAAAKAVFGNDGNVTLGGLDVVASGIGLDVNSVVGDIHANATASIDAGSVTINGNATVTARGTTPRTKFVLVHASLNIDANQIGITNNAVVEATADNANFGEAASAFANMELTANNGHITVGGDATVDASADNGGGSKAAEAFAKLNMNAVGSIDITGDVTDLANAQVANLTNHHPSTANASASVDLKSRNADILINGHLDVEADVSSSSTASVRAKADANLTAHSGVTVNGLINVIANASGDGGASANGQLSVGATYSGAQVNLKSVTVKASADAGTGRAIAHANAHIVGAEIVNAEGNVDVEANAQDPSGSSANAFAELLVQAGSIHIGNGSAGQDGGSQGNVTVRADAFDSGAGRALALANALISTAIPDGPVIVEGDITVVANANDIHGTHARGSAILNVKGGAVTIGHGTDGGTSSGDINVEAFADAGGTGVGQAFANAQANIHGNGRVTVDGNVFVEASAIAAGLGIDIPSTATAAAVAHLSVNGSYVHLGHATGSSGSIPAIAVLAFASGVHNANEASANASANIHARNRVVISGGVIVQANAFESHGGLASASAHLHVNGSNVTIGVESIAFNTGGGVSYQNVGMFVGAFATNNGLGKANAHASASVKAHSGEGGTAGSVLIKGPVNVAAVALSNGGNSASADAELSLAADNVTIGNTSSAGVSVFARAQAGFGPAHAKAQADITAHSGKISISGSLGVHATADNTGGGPAIALAFANLTAAGDGGSIDIGSNAIVTANANNGGGTSGKVAASANAALTFANAADVTVGSNMSVVAHATNFGAGKVKAHGAVDFGSANTITLGNVLIDVEALNENSAGSGGAVASANFAPGINALSVHGLNVHAVASSYGGQGALANAFVSLNESYISIPDGVTVLAAALNGRSTGNANAIAVLDLVARNGNITIGSLDVEAHANDLGNGLAEASANALLDPASGNGTHSINIAGSAAVIADAFDLGNNGNAIARADANFLASNAVDFTNALVVDAFALDSYGTTASAKAILNISGKTVSIGHGSVTFSSIDANGGRNPFTSDIGVFVGAFAIDHGAVGNAVADASANIRASSGDGGAFGNVTVGGAAIFSALASDTGGHHANAQAHLQVNGANVTFNGGTVDIGGLHNDFIGLFERAIAIAGNDGTAVANAIGSVHANSALLINGEVVDLAVAFNPGGGGNALADAQLSLTANGGNATIDGSLLVAAHASDGGSGSAVASASADIKVGGANRTINIASGASVFANAHNANGFGSNVAASANAHLNFSGATYVTVGNYVDVGAIADNLGAGGVQAHGVLDFHGASKLTLGDVLIDVEALNEGSSGTGGASASAQFIQNNVGVTLHINSLNLQAVASSLGTTSNAGGAFAHANGDIVQNTLTISGNVTVDATATRANDSSGAKNASARADLTLTAHSGLLSIGGALDVEAHANDAGNGAAIANATATLDPLSNIHIGGNVLVEASAHHSGNATSDGLAASANAHLNFANANLLTVVGSMSVVANATNSGHGRINAHAAVDFGSINNITLDNVLIDVEALNEKPSGSGGASASAQFIQNNAGVTLHINSLNLQAKASSLGTGSNAGRAFAHATGDIVQNTLTISGNVTVDATATRANASSSENASARADLTLTAHTGLLSIGGALDVEAHANDAGDGAAIANATATLDPLSTIHIGGNVLVAANAHHSGNASSSSLAASANAHLKFTNANAVTVSGNMSILAHATNEGAGKVHASGSVSFGTGANAVHSITLGDVLIDVEALNLRNSGSGGANANAIFSFGGSRTVSVAGLDIHADAVSYGGDGALANAVAGLTQSHISIAHDVTVRADAFDGVGAGNATALAALDLVATKGAITLDGGVDVSAVADDSGAGNAVAKASATLSAQSHEVSVNNAIVVDAVANDVGGTLASANGILHVNGSEVLIGKQLVQFGSGDSATYANVGVFVGGFANDALAGGKARSKALANIFASTEEGFGNITIGAAAIVSASASANAGSANAQARLHVNGANVTFDGGTDRINSEIFSTSYVGVKVVADASDHADGVAFAVASGDIFANDSLNITRRVLDSAYADNPVGGGNASAMASLTLKAEHGDVTIHDSTIDGAFLSGGSIFVNANADNGGASYNAMAHADLKITALSGDAIASGSVGVDAHASHGVGGGIASAGAFATLNAAHELSIGGSGLFLSANAHGVGGQHLVLARAMAELRGSTIRVDAAEVNAAANAGSVDTVQAAASLNAFAADDVEIFGGFGVHAVANGFDVRDAQAVAEANLKAGGTVDILFGDIDVTASASSDGTRDGRAILVEANAQLAVAANAGMTFGTSFTNASGQHVFGGDITVTANERSNRASNGSAIAHANLHASTADGSAGGRLLVFGNVLVEADANGQSRSENVEAMASIQANAYDEASFAGNITVLGNALDSGDGNVTAISKLRLFASSIQIGDVLANHNIGGHVLVEATANGVDNAENDMALASFKGTATSGSINISAPVKVTADALSTRDGRVVQAVAELDLTAESNLVLPGAIVLADAVASGFASYINAQADLHVSAGQNVDVTHNGLFAQANASASSAGNPGTANALINVTGGHDVVIDGNVDAIAVVLSNHSSNLARALINIQAGTSGSGSLTMVSNIEALALADPHNDVATAGVTLNAEDNILVFGQDPIADAHAGDGTTAFLQTHFTTNLTNTGSSDSVANAFIHIRSVDGSVIFINGLNNDQEGALRALASDYPNTNSGSLTAIELLINGIDCGVLGSAGSPNRKGEACAKSAFNIEGSDTLP